MAATICWSFAIVFLATSAGVAVEFEPPNVLESPNAEKDGWFGAVVSWVPDVNGDGKADVLVGAPHESPGSSPYRAGRVYIFDGVTRALLRELKAPSESSGAGFGSGLAGIVDINGDGRGDVIAGTGSVAHVFDGATGNWIYQFSNARHLSTVPDVNGDGHSDIVTSDYSAIRLVDGKMGEQLLSIPNPGTDNLFGWSLSGIPDLNGDGRGDVIAGAWAENLPVTSERSTALARAGRVYVFDGATGERLYQLTSPDERANGQFGRSVAGVEDLNGDGRGDFATIQLGVGGPPAISGRVYTYDGATGQLLRSTESVAPTTGTRGNGFDYMAAVPDVTGDGRADFMVGGSNNGDPMYYLFDGASSALTTTLPYYSEPGLFPYSGLPDVNGDGLGEVIIGAGYDAQVHLFLSKFVPVPEDCDEDDLSDHWEYANFGNPGAEGCDLEFLEPITPDGDPDNDGADNKKEHDTGTNPMAADTDEDGLDDGVETDTGNYVSASDTGTDPLNPDTDGDGLADGVETSTGTFVSASDTGTDPISADTDSDRLADGAETNTGTFVSSADTGSDPLNADTDGDGAKDGTEALSALGSCVLDPTCDPVPPVPSLLVYWNFDKGDGDAVDLVEQRVATVNGPTYVEGVSGAGGDRALRFEPEGGSVHVEDAGFMNVAAIIDQSTIVLWQKNLGTPNSSSFWFNSESSDRGMRGAQAHIPWSNHNVYWDTVGWSSSNRVFGEPAGRVNDFNWSDQQWHHWVFWKDGDKKRVYVDGQRFLSGTGAIPFPQDFTDGYIGGERQDGGNNPDAIIDDFAVFASPLSQEEIDRLVAGESPCDLDPGCGGNSRQFQISAIDLEADSLTITWTSLPGKSYAVEYQAVLGDDTWIEIGQGITAKSFTDSQSTRLAPAAGWYRVREE